MGAFAYVALLLAALGDVTDAGVVPLLGVVTLMETYIPARRASRVAPMVAVRYE